MLLKRRLRPGEYLWLGLEGCRVSSTFRVNYSVKYMNVPHVHEENSTYRKEGRELNKSYMGPSLQPLSLTLQR